MSFLAALGRMRPRGIADCITTGGRGVSPSTSRSDSATALGRCHWTGPSAALPVITRLTSGRGRCLVKHVVRLKGVGSVIDTPVLAGSGARRARRDSDGGKGSAKNRRRRKRWLVDHFGDGVTVPCWRCSKPLTVETVTADRYPIPGWKGGTYRRDNIRPCCLTCNVVDGAKMGRARQTKLKNKVACCRCGHVMDSRHANHLVQVGVRWQCRSTRHCRRRQRLAGIEPVPIRRACPEGCECGKHHRTELHNIRIGMSVALTAEAKRIA